MKQHNKLWALFIALIALVALCAVSASAEIIDSGTCGDGLTYTVDDQGLLTISGTGEMEYGKFQGWNSIYAVVIEDGVTSISSYAFPWCNNLQSIEISNTVENIGELAFYDCDTLQSVVIPNSVTSIGQQAFYDCDNLTRIHLGTSIQTLDGDSVGSEWNDRPMITTCMTAEDWEQRGLSYSNKILTNVHIANETETACAVCGTETTVFNAASGSCGDNLTWSFSLDDGILTISGTGAMADYERWSESNRAPWFKYRSAISSVVIEEGVTSIGNSAFYECRAMQSVTIPSTVTTIGEAAFQYCYALQELTLPEELTSIGYEAFQNCDALQSVTIPGSVTSFGYGVFDSCDALQSAVISEGVTEIGEGMFNSCRNLQSVEIPSTITSIGYSAFYGCELLSDLTIPEGIEEIGQEAFKNTAYYNNSSNWYNDGFYIGKFLLEVNRNTSGTFTVKEGTERIVQQAAYNCRQITKLVVSEGVTAIDRGAFYQCAALQTVELPETLVTIGDMAFYQCTALKTIGLPNSLETIGGNAFGACNALRSITIPPNVTNAIGIFTGETASNVEHITIADGLKRLDTAMLALTQIEEIVIPNSVESIGMIALAGCSELKDIYIGTGIRTVGYTACTNAIANLLVAGQGLGPFDDPQRIHICMTEEEWNEKVTILKNVTQEEADSLSMGVNASDFPEANWVSDNTTVLFDSHHAGEPVRERVVPATCASAGHYDKVTYCTICGKEASRETIETDPATGHNVPTVTWNWANDGSSATVTGTCTLCNEPITAEADVTSSTANGVTTCFGVATLGGQTFTDVITIPDPTIEPPEPCDHQVTAVSWTWANDGSLATAVGVCTLCNQPVSAVANVQTVTNADGSKTCTATVTLGGQTFTDVKTISGPIIEPPVSCSHQVTAVSWAWTTDGSAATAIGVCTLCNQPVSAVANVQTVTNADGSKTCTATVTLGGQTFEATKIVSFSGDPTPHTSKGRCSMCNFYEEYKNVPFVGWIVSIVHFFVHMSSRIGK